MSGIKRLMLASFCISVLSITAARAGDHGPRQFYSGWQHHQQGNFHHRNFYYKPTPDFHGFKHHHVIRPKHDPKHLYFYNPYKAQFWGRCPADYGDKPVYSLLAPKDRKATLAEIPEAAFPKAGALPPIPESTDGELIDLPPDDSPEPTTLPKATAAK